MEKCDQDFLHRRGCSHNRNKNNSSSGRSKSRGFFKSQGNSIKVCWVCGKKGNYKKNCRYKIHEKGEGYKYSSSTKDKTSYY